MGNATITAEEYWGYLIQQDKTPTPLFEQFLLSIASYIKKHIAPWDVNCLTPIKLAAFYRLVGGDFDALFLGTLPSSLSIIYQSLGCFHTLQPDHDPYLPPSIPALTPQGFVRWQTAQLLLGPAEHVPLLQKAVKSFEIVHLGDGSEFPKVLPKTAFPITPDLEMIEWHEGVSEKLRVKAAPSTQRNVPETTARGEHDMDGDAASTTQSSIEERSVADAAEYSAERHFRPPFVRPNIGTEHMPAPPYTYPQQQQQWLAPDSDHYHRRRSFPDNHHRENPYWSNDARTPTQATAPYHHPRSRPTTPSTLSTVSDSSSDDDDDSSTATSEASRSPVVRYEDRPHLYPPSAGQERRHSAHSPYDSRDFVTPRPPDAGQRPQQGYFDQERLPATPPRGTARGLNVQWRDVNHMWDLPGSAPATPGAHHGARPVEGRGESSRAYAGSRRVGGPAGGPLRGVGGRRYPTDGISWA